MKSISPGAYPPSLELLQSRPCSDDIQASTCPQHFPSTTLTEEEAASELGLEKWVEFAQDMQAGRWCKPRPERMNDLGMA